MFSIGWRKQVTSSKQLESEQEKRKWSMKPYRKKGSVGQRQIIIKNYHYNTSMYCSFFLSFYALVFFSIFCLDTTNLWMRSNMFLKR